MGFQPITLFMHSWFPWVQFFFLNNQKAPIEGDKILLQDAKKNEFAEIF